MLAVTQLRSATYILYVYSFWGHITTVIVYIIMMYIALTETLVDQPIILSLAEIQQQEKDIAMVTCYIVVSVHSLLWVTVHPFIIVQLLYDSESTCTCVFLLVLCLIS